MRVCVCVCVCERERERERERENRVWHKITHKGWYTIKHNQTKTDQTKHPYRLWKEISDYDCIYIIEGWERLVKGPITFFLPRGADHCQFVPAEDWRKKKWLVNLKRFDDIELWIIIERWNKKTLHDFMSKINIEAVKKSHGKLTRNMSVFHKLIIFCVN